MLLLASAGWLHLESAALRNEIEIPSSAKRPQLGVPATAASRESVRSVQSSPDPSAVVAPSLGVGPSSTAGSTDSASSQGAESFRPAAEPPQLNILAPRELMANNEEANTPVTPAANLTDASGE